MAHSEHPHAALLWDGLSLDIGGNRILRGVTLSVAPGETLALVGESGSGKTMCCMAALGLLPEGAVLTSGKIVGLGKTWATAGNEPLHPVPRGSRVAMVFQEPMTSLNPTMRCGTQLTEVIRRHQNGTPAEAKLQAEALLKEVQIPDTKRALRAYPHELSGGQKQRVLIAMALANGPDILLADEPTTALDSTLRRDLLDLLKALQAKRGLAMVLVSHDMEVVEQHADQVAVMFNGEVVEWDTVQKVIASPTHPYTRGLLACRVPDKGRPSPLPILSDFLTEGHGGVAAATREIRPAPGRDAQPVLRITGATKTYPGQSKPAIQSVSLDLPVGGSLGIVGGSGCGKTTLARAILGLHQLDAGTIEIQGEMVHGGSRNEIQHIRSNVGLVFQDPRAALNPALRIGPMLTEVLRQWGTPKSKAIDKAIDLLCAVGLDRSALNKRPDSFSGGQRQRIVIARALAANPKLLICDEAVAALDVSVQAQVLNLLVELQAKRGLSLLFISHDLGVVRYLCDRTAVMAEGRIVEEGDSDAIWSTPHHPVTRRLQAAGGGSID
ncbi:MAG: ABC transporter ATP-binding protein [Flavobacteriales bacterium]|nr:ABC transporter ATP-binding protein [Flavobacteriales bacterium]